MMRIRSVYIGLPGTALPGALVRISSAVAAILCASTAGAQSADELAKKLSNPVAALISVPIQINYDADLGADGNGDKFLVNVQPVVPVSLNKDWNLISRTILPIIEQSDVFPGTSQSGIGDVVQSVFFSPKAPTTSGWIWGVGPVLLLPTASDDLLGSEKWGAGPTAVVLKQAGPVTYGLLVNHIASFAGDDNRSDVNATFLQPFFSKGLGKGLTAGVNFESTYDWENEQWNVPVNVFASKVTKIGNQLVSFSAGARYYVEKPDNGADWGVRLAFTLLYPR